jgi:transcription termination factor Rho
MDEVIFEEFKGTGNSEIQPRPLARREAIFPAINSQTSGTRKEEKLFSQHEYEKVKKLRGALYALKPVEAMERLLKSLGEFRSNAEFLETI